MLRYSRQMVLPQVGVRGQKALLQGKVHIVGAGGLGLPCAQALVAGGLKELCLVDDDVVSLSNLQRQFLFTDSDLGCSKVEAAKLRLQAVNPDVNIHTYQQRVNAFNIIDLFKDYDLIIDCSDNFDTKFLINDACLKLRKPWVYGSVSRFEGQFAVFGLPGGPCYRCLYPQSPTVQIDNCAEQGVLGSVTSVVGAWQALEAQKFLLGNSNGDDLAPLSKLKVYDFERHQIVNLSIHPRPNCLCHGDREFTLEQKQQESGCQLNSVSGEVKWSTFFKCSDEKILLDVRTREEFDQFHPPAAIHWEPRTTVLPQAAKIFLYCRSGKRSLQKAHEFSNLGISAVSIEGGLERL